MLVEENCVASAFVFYFIVMFVIYVGIKTWTFR